ncbi:MAG TPA: J domain-containing protein [Phototrophicaceae bacterium]|jgi:hypothetical protein|nr:J domain-containing protein [Phototrophicaceae bacterium]
MNNEASELNQLRASVAAQEREVAKLESEITELDREIEDFRARYQSAVGFSESRLHGAKELLSQLERERAQAYNPVSSRLPPGFVSVEEQYRQRRGDLHNHDSVPSPTPPPDEELSPADLKSIYRKLARLYHPDFGEDETDRERRTRLMALINEAYAAGDLEALKLLQKGIPEDKLTQVDARKIQADQSLAMLQLHQLRQADVSLSIQLEMLKSRRSELLNSEWMNLKVEEKLRKLRGRDLFKEMIAGFDREFDEIRVKIDRLKP